jgi:hypothetical protein
VGIDPSMASIPVDVWIGSDGLVRRVQIGVSGLQPTTPSTASPTGVGGTLTMEFYDWPAGGHHHPARRPGLPGRPVDAGQPGQAHRRVRWARAAGLRDHEDRYR